MATPCYQPRLLNPAPNETNDVVQILNHCVILLLGIDTAAVNERVHAMHTSDTSSRIDIQLADDFTKYMKHTRQTQCMQRNVAPHGLSRRVQRAHKIHRQRAWKTNYKHKRHGQR